MSIYLFDITETLIGMVDPRDVIESEQDYTLNSLITASFRAKYDPIIDDAIFFGHRDVDEPQNFWLYRITDAQKSGNVIDVSGTYSFFDDLQGGIVRDLRPENKKAGVVLRQILEDNRWLVGTDKSTTVRSASFYYTSKLDAFWQMLDRWGVEFKPRITYSNGTITGRYIDLANHFAEDAGKWYEHGDKLLTVKASTNSGSVYTAFLGRGKGEEKESGGYGRRITFVKESWSVENGDPVDKPAGLDYVEIPTATALYGYQGQNPRVKIVEFSDVTDPGELLSLTYLYGLNHCRPLVHYEATVAETDYADPGEIVAIIRPDLGIRYKTRIFRIRRDLLVRGRKTIEFGEQLVRSQAQRAVEQRREQKQQNEEIQSVYEATRQEIIDSYFNEDAYTYRLEAGNKYGLPAGTYSYDKPIDENPTKVIYFGAGKLLIANHKDADGSWAWSTFADGNGLGASMVGAEQIAAGAINATHISAEGIDAGQINVTDSINLEEKLTNIDQELAGLYDLENASFLWWPHPPYHVDDVWRQPEMTLDELEALRPTVDELIEIAVDVVDYVGGNIYVCTVARESGKFNRADWLRVVSSGATIKQAELDAEGLRLTERVDSLDGRVRRTEARQEMADGRLQTVVTDLNSLQDSQLVMLQSQEEWELQLQSALATAGANDEAISAMTQFLRYGAEGLRLGSSDSPMSVLISNGGIDFLDGETPVARITGQQLHIASAVIVQALVIGNHKFEPDEDSNDVTVVRWLGGS